MLTRSIRQIILALAIAALVGCASLPSPEVMKAETATFRLPSPSTAAGRAVVYVVRPSGLAGMIPFEVYVDDREATSRMGYTWSGQFILFALDPGEHRILSKAENWAELVITAHANERIFIEQTPTLGVVVSRNRLAQIGELEGRYRVKTLSPGTIVQVVKPPAGNDGGQTN